MVGRKVKSASPKKVRWGKCAPILSTGLFRPVEEGYWEHWQMDSGWKLCKRGNLEELIVGRDAYLALPARLIISIPVWLPKVDLSLAKEMVQVELDIRGLVPKEGTLTVRMICSVDERMLICAQVFPSPFPAKFSHSTFGFFNASPLFASLEEDTLHLWQEGGDIVAVFTKGEEPIYWETIPFGTSHSELLSWLECMRFPLRESLSPTMGFISFLDFDLLPPSFCERMITTQLSYPLLSEKLPLCDWKSPQRQALEKAQQLRKTYIQIATGTSGLYLLFILVFFGWVGICHWEAGRMRQRISVIEPEVRNLQEARRQWNILVPTIEPGRFPVEILHLIVGQMPPEGMWLTQFEFEQQKLAVSGEAENVSMAAQFFTNISEKLSQIRWEMPPPALLSNNKARFVISGVINEAN